MLLKQRYLLLGFAVDCCLHMVEDFTQACAEREDKIAVYTMSSNICQAWLASPLGLDSTLPAFSAVVIFKLMLAGL